MDEAMQSCERLVRKYMTGYNKHVEIPCAQSAPEDTPKLAWDVIMEHGTELSSFLQFQRAFRDHENHSLNQSIVHRLLAKSSVDVEDTIHIHLNLISRLSDCNSTHNFIYAVLSYLKDLYGVKYSTFIKHYETYIVMFIGVVFGIQLVRNSLPKGKKKRKSKHIGSYSYAQSGIDRDRFKDLLGQLRQFVGGYDQVKNSEFVTRLVSFSGLVICTPLFVKLGFEPSWIGFSELNHQAYRKKYNKSFSHDLILEILDHSAFILDRVCDFVETKSYKSLYVTDKDVAAYEEDYDLLLHYSDKFSLLANRGMSVEDYVLKCDSTIEKGKKLKDYFSSNRFAATTFKNQQSNLKRFKMRGLDKMAASSSRQMPVSLILYGPPCIGKSAIMDKLLHCLYENDKLLGVSTKSYDPSVKYVFNEDDEYMSEFKVSHEVCILDDLDQHVDKINEAKKGGSIGKLIYFANNVPYMTNQAHLDDKGMIPFLCGKIIGTTNTFDAGISKVFRKQGGAYRRFDFIDIEVKPEYRTEGSTRLEGDMSPEGYKNHEMHHFYARRYFPLGDISVPRYWNVETSTWVNNKGACPPMTFAQLSVYCLEQVQKPRHEATKKTEKSVKDFLSKPHCPECLKPGTLCDCDEAQSALDRETLTDDYWLEQSGVINVASWFAFFIVAWHLIWCFIYWFGHTVFCKAYGKNKPNLFTHRFITEMQKLPQYENAPFLIRCLPKCVLCYVVCEGWRTYMYDMCRSFYNCGVLGKFVETRRAAVKHKYSIAGAVSLLLGLRALYVAYDRFVSQSRPLVEGDGDDENPWVTEVQDFAVLEQEGAARCTTFDKLLNSIESNIVHVIVRLSPTERIRTNGLAPCGNKILIPHHFYKEMCGKFPLRMDVLRCHDKTRIGPSRFGIQIDESNFSIPPGFEGKDLVVFDHLALGVFRDIRRYILQDPIKGVSKTTLVKRNVDGRIERIRASDLRPTTAHYNSNVGPYTYPGLRGYTDKETIVGDCGAPYIAEFTNGVAIVGLHIAGKKWLMHKNMVTVEPLAGFVVPKCRGLNPHSFNGIDLNESYQTEKDLTIHPEVDPKCPMRKVAPGTATIYGGLKLHRRKLKSKVEPTLMSEEVLEHYGKLDFTHHSPKGINSRIAAEINISPMVSKPSFKPKNIIKAEDALYTWYTDVIAKHELFVPDEPYDLSVAMNGFDGVKYVDRIPLKTSAGFGHKTKKSNYVTLDEPEEGHAVKYTVSPEIMKEYNDLKRKYLDGQRGNVVWDFNFKDEPVSSSKIRDNNCRIFNSAPFHFQLLLRQYFLWCIPLFSGKHRHEFGMAIGVNPISDDWTMIRNWLTRFGEDRLIAGDYKKFDKKQPPEILASAFNVLIRIAKDHGWSDEDLIIMEGIATDVIYPLCNVFGTIVEFNGSNPSGQNLTTPINGMTNIMYIMLACMDIEEEANKSIIDYDKFYDFVSIVTFGDDNVMGSKYDLFNHTSLSNSLAKFGVQYTMADKESASVPLIKLEDVDFLKRRFVDDTLMKGHTAAPLAESSLLKSLSICTRSDNISKEAQCAEIIESANREYYQYGKEKHDKERVFLQSLVDKYNLGGHLTTHNLKTFEEYHTEQFGYVAQSAYEEEYMDVSSVCTESYDQWYRLDSSSDSEESYETDFSSASTDTYYGNLRRFHLIDSDLYEDHGLYLTFEHYDSHMRVIKELHFLKMQLPVAEEVEAPGVYYVDGDDNVYDAYYIKDGAC